jgi:hypothetical protein
MKTTKKELKQMINAEINRCTIELDIFNTVRAALENQEGKKITRRFTSIVEKALIEKFGSGIFHKQSYTVHFDHRTNSMINLEINALIVGRDRPMSILIFNSFSRDKIFFLKHFDDQNTCWSSNEDRIKSMNEDLKNDKKLSEYLKNAKKFNEGYQFFKDQSYLNTYWYYDFKRAFLLGGEK